MWINVNDTRGTRQLAEGLYDDASHNEWTTVGEIIDEAVTAGLLEMTDDGEWVKAA